MNKKYVVTLTDEERRLLRALVSSGKGAARKLTQEHVLDVTATDPEFSNYDTLAIVDGDVIPDEVATIFAEGRQTDVPVMIGSNANEGTTFLEFFTPMFGEGKAGFTSYLEATLPAGAATRVHA